MTGYQMLGYTVTLSPEAIVGDGLDLSGSGSGSGGGSGSVVVSAVLARCVLVNRLSCFFSLGCYELTIGVALS